MRHILVVDDDLHTRLAIGMAQAVRVQGRDHGWRRERPRQAKALRHSLLSSTLTRRRKSPAPPT
jgi:hypothetical protein